MCAISVALLLLPQFARAESVRDVMPPRAVYTGANLILLTELRGPGILYAGGQFHTTPTIE